MTPPTDDIPWEQLTAWLVGTLPSAEAAELSAWIAVDPARREFVASLRAIWDGAAEARPSWNARAALDTIKQRAADRPNVLPLPSQFTLQPVTARRRPAMAAAMAAAAIAAVAVAGWWMTTVLPRADKVQAAADTDVVRYATARGQRLAFKLPDGSGVVLGPESVLRYSRAYGRRVRAVELEGDGAFTIAHDTARPFEVRTARAVARDLGTRFVVRARPAAASVDVAVSDGRVALGRVLAPRNDVPEPLADSVVLGPSDWGRVEASGTLSRRRGVALDQYFGWTEGRLVFRAAALADVVAELNRWYDVDIRFADDTVGRLRLTAVFHDQPITTVLSLVETSLGVTVTGAGRRFILARR